VGPEGVDALADALRAGIESLPATATDSVASR
jgi:hypothetical protein